MPSRIVRHDPSNRGCTVTCPDLPAGSVVRVAAKSGRTLLARSDPGGSRRLSPGTVGLGGDQREVLGVRVADHVTVEPADVPDAAEVTLVPAFAVEPTRADEEAVARHLREHRVPLRLGDRVRVPFGTGGAAVFVVGAVDGPGGGEGVVDATTRVRLRAPTPAELAQAATRLTIRDVGGMHDVLPRLREAVEVPLTAPQLYRDLGIVAPRGVLLHGPPGAGKTYLARALAGEIDAALHLVSGPELVGSSYGRTEANLRTVFADAARDAPSLVLVDEIDAVAPNRAQVGAQADYRMVTQLLALMDGLHQVDGVVVLATTNRPDAIDPALRRPGRFDVEIFVGPPSEAERREILGVYLARMPLTDEARATVPALAAATHGYLPADLMALTREAGLAALRRRVRAGGELAGIVVEASDLAAARDAIAPSLLRGAAARLPSHRLDDLVTNAAVDRLRELAAAAGGGTARAPAVLLAGPSGAGKTACAHGLAAALDAHLIEVSPADVFSSWLGETEEAVRSLFRLAAFVAPAVVVLDRLDGFAPRGHDTGPAARRVASQLVREMEDLPPAVSVVGTVVDPAAVDPAVVHRFAEVVHLALPGRAERVEVARRARAGLATAAAEAVADATEGLPYDRVARTALQSPD